MKRYAYTLVLTFLIVGFFYQSANACSVIETPLRKQFRRADVVFIGKVSNIIQYKPSEKERLLMPEEWRSWNDFSKVTFEIKKKWKGKVSKTQAFISFADVCACSQTVSEFEKGKGYLVFSEEKSFVTICDSNESESETTKREIKRLNNFGFRLWARIYPF